MLERLCLLYPFWSSLLGQRDLEEDMVKFFIFGLWKWGLSLKGSQHARRSSQAAVSNRDRGHSAEGRGPRWGGVYTAVLAYSEEEVVVDWVKADPWAKPLRLIMEGWKLGCRRACLMRWSLRMKRLSQSGHRKRFSPVWVRRCRANSSERANFFSQSGQVHGNGLSPRQKHEWSTTH